MENKDKVISELFARLDQLNAQQKVFHDEIQKIRRDIQRLQLSDSQTRTFPERPAVTSLPEQKAETFFSDKTNVPAQRLQTPEIRKRSKTAWEEFIGENLLNKVGIAVLVLGIAFGAKYSIDRGLIDPLTRIILGYISGLILLGIAYSLREKHMAFSSVLLSGGMAVFYFITFAAYSFYGLIPQTAAFALMVFFTVFTVLAALRYNYEVIGIIGLVGAYAVPFLLSDGSGRVVVLFSYMAIINAGILFLAFRKYWKRLYYFAFALTWLAFASWFAFSFNRHEHITVSLVFSTIFFVTFYATFLAYKILRSEPLGKWDIICMLLNSFIYFGYGYLTVDSSENGEQFLGLFTLVTAMIHFMACALIYKIQARSGDIFYFVAGLVLVFITIAVPVQLEGNWVTLVWAAEAVLLFWIGRAKSFPTYEKISYPLIVLAFLSLLHDWSNAYPPIYYYSGEFKPDLNLFLNIDFVTSMLVGVSFVLLLRVRGTHPGNQAATQAPLSILLTIGLPALTVFIFYVGIFKEIEAFWYNEYAASRVSVRGSEGVEYDRYNEYLLNLKNIWLITYSALFAMTLALLQWRWRTDYSVLGCLAFNVIVLFSFITVGLLDLSALRAGHLEQDLASNYPPSHGYVYVRYIVIASIIPLLILNRRLVRLEYFNTTVRNAENLTFHFIVLVLLSSELIHWLDMAGVGNSFRLSLSMLWGTYALLLIIIGLSRDIRHLRLAAIVLFAVTLLKLFAYDMEDMSAILKTVVMIVLGALLLIASFIYNRYKRSAGNEVP